MQGTGRIVTLAFYRLLTTEHLFHHYEIWSMKKVGKLSSNAFSEAASHINGVPAPEGYVWVRTFYNTPSLDENWAVDSSVTLSEYNQYVARQRATGNWQG